MTYEIYQLKGIDDAFYIALSHEGELIIYKYLFLSKLFKEISIIEYNGPRLRNIRIKYFYNPLNKKEYLFVTKTKDNNNLYILKYLIKKENEFKLIYGEETINKFEIMKLSKFTLDLYYFEDIKAGSLDIIYNKHDKNIYVIISNIVRDENPNPNLFDSNNEKTNVDVYKFIKNDLKKVNSFVLSSCDYSIPILLYENKIFQKYNIIIIKDKTIQFAEIGEKMEFKSLIDSEEESKKLNDVFHDLYFYSCCIVSNKDKIDFLYIFVLGIKYQIIIFNLFSKKIIKIIDAFRMYRSLINWNNKYIILSTFHDFSIFDTKTNQIVLINKLYPQDNILSIRPFFSKFNKFIGLFILTKFDLQYYFINN